MYAFPNSGGWYDFGLFLGVCVWGRGELAALLSVYLAGWLTNRNALNKRHITGNCIVMQ
jgi:hypothetical protein